MSGSILTGVPVHARHGRAPVAAIGLRDGVVAALGDVDEVRAALPGAPVVELGRGAVLPAFVDPHQHAFLVAIDPAVDVLHRRADDVDGLLRELCRLVADAPGGDGWLRFHGYEPLRLAERRSPTSAELDTVCADRPLHVVSRTYHESAVNTEGLRALGIGSATADPPGGRVVRDRRGAPTGVLLESVSFAAEAASRQDDAGWRERARAHARRILAAGITRIADAAVPADLADEFLGVMRDTGVEVEPLLIGPRIDVPAFVPGRAGKVLVDGGEYCHFCFTRSQALRLGSQSLRAAFTPDRDLVRALARRAGRMTRGAGGTWHTGVTVTDERLLRAHLEAAADAGAGLAVHAVGNGAVDEVLRVLGGDRGLRRDVDVRVEHAMVIDADQCAALGALGVPVVVQPGFLSTTGYELEVTPVPAPLELMPFRSMVDSGGRLAFSSDYPATPMDPWRWVADAVARRDDRGVLRRVHQRVDVRAALLAATEGGALALGVDAGHLDVGARADLVWVDADPYAVDPERLGDIATLATWRAGDVVHAAEPAGPIVGRT